MKANIKTAKHCAFCRYWHDLSNRCISPSSSGDFLWEFNPAVLRKCLKNDIETRGADSCPDYELKISV